VTLHDLSRSSSRKISQSCRLCQDPTILSLPKPLLSLLLACVLLPSAACKRSPKRGELAPLTASSWCVQLDVKGFGPATLALPLAATTPRPIVVVLHGARDRAEWQCGSFRGLLGGQVFILCPRGQVVADGLYGLGSIDDAEAELRASLTALKARFGAHVAPRPILLIGYAEGADVAADLARQEPSFFSRVALVKGNPSLFSSSSAKIFAERGGKRMLFFCTDLPCEQAGAERALSLSRAGVAAQSVRRDVGPYLDPPFIAALKGEMPWLLEGDARFNAARR
jgi:pimeloyl-ACP methyl ester carboxylesterase